NLRASLERAVATAMPDAMDIQPYPLQRADGSWEERYWSPLNTPVADPETGRITHLIHRVRDVTDVARLTAANDRLRDDNAHSKRANVVLTREATELEHANEQLQEQAAELEMQATELHAVAAELEERTLEAEAALRLAHEERERATTILEAMSDAHILLDREFRFRSVNAAAERSLGIGRGDLIGRSHWDVLPESRDSEPGRAYRRAAELGEEIHLDTRYEGDGYDADLLIDIYPTREGGIAVFWRDITEKRRREAELRESDARYKSLFDSLDEGFCVIEMLYEDGRPVDYRMLETNPAFVAQTGLVDAVGKRASELLRGHETPWVEVYGRVADTGEAVRFENAAESLGRYFDVYAFRVGEPEERRVAVLFRDKSEAYRAERERERLMGALELERRRLEEVFRRAPTFMVALRGPEHVYEFVNQAYYQLVGDRDVVGKPLMEALPELRAQGFGEILDSVLRTGEPWVGHEAPVELHRVPGGPVETRYITTVFQPLTEASGERSGVVVHGSDVTEQVEARREVERLLAESEGARREAEAARAEAEAANRAKSEFLAVMSHELRTPLNAIGGYAELLDMGLRGPVTEAQRADLARIRRSQRHLLTLINDILNFARLEAGRVEFHVAPVVLRDVLADVDSLVAPQMATKGLA
ncbi:MAG TPA: PAS domain-containing protein, partial [Longimicrobium sp.]